MDILFNTFPTLETDRLLLRKMTNEDAQNVFDYFSDDLVTRYFGLDNFTSIDEAEKIIESFNKAYEKRQAIRWGIAQRDTNEIIGSIGFHNISSVNKRVEIGYEITRKEWNKGYATEALHVAITYIFDIVQINRIGATVRPENVASKQLLMKIGFIEEGVLKDYQFTRGSYFDLIMYSLLCKDIKK